MNDHSKHADIQRVLRSINALLYHYGDEEGLMIDCLADNLEALARRVYYAEISSKEAFAILAEDITEGLA